MEMDQCEKNTGHWIIHYLSGVWRGGAGHGHGVHHVLLDVGDGARPRGHPPSHALPEAGVRQRRGHLGINVNNNQLLVDTLTESGAVLKVEQKTINKVWRKCVSRHFKMRPFMLS